MDESLQTVAGLDKDMILTLAEKGVKTLDDLADLAADELMEALKGLGYKDKDIKAILPKVNKENKLEEQIKEALRLLVGR